MTLYVDTSVIMYAGGADHPKRDGCRAALRAVLDGAEDAVTSAEVVQEILHRFGRADRQIGTAMAQSTITMFAPLVAIDDAVIARAVDLFASMPRLSSRDVIHVAVCRELGIDRILTVDQDFDSVGGLTRVDPDTFL
ncbi:type II toxin-antitoxin system VapC family toxin [Euzebya sp.]|uniref:type II toxin-antitoxin system VapC family toxin n=1 Tax=Euzebya sp. TaxID=1971409 RepID=UPI0035165A81